NEEIEEIFRHSIEELKNLGATVTTIEIPFMKEALSCWKIILYSEATAYHQDNMKHCINKFDNNVRLMLEAGSSISSVEYIKANQFRMNFIKTVSEMMKNYDGLLLTSLPINPPKIDEDEVYFLGKSLSAQSSMTYIAWFANLLGFPQISLPCGLTKNKLPVGLAILSKKYDDFKLLEIGKYYQKNHFYHNFNPFTK
ncbi:MAG: amidase family protein, partial [Ostreibacterium sp.]